MFPSYVKLPRGNSFVWQHNIFAKGQETIEPTKGAFCPAEVKCQPHGRFRASSWGAETKPTSRSPADTVDDCKILHQLLGALSHYL